MGKPLLGSDAVSAFCESMALMLSAGIQTDEAVSMLAENRGDPAFRRLCDSMYARLANGAGLAEAMTATSAFPRYAIDMVRTGESSGHLEQVLRSLGVYYDEEDRLFAKIRSSIAYPVALLCIMSVVLAFTVAVILPVFIGVYDSLAGSLTAGSFGAVGASVVIGYIALAAVVLCTALALAGVLAVRSERGRQAVMRLLERVPLTRDAMYQLALSRFTAAVAIHIASGANSDDAMREAASSVEYTALGAKVRQAYEAMIDPTAPKSLAQAIGDHEVFEAVYQRLLVVGTRAGSLDEVLERLSSTFFDNAVQRLDRVVDAIEPALAAFVMVAVGATLISVMLPLVGIMGSVG